MRIYIEVVTQDVWLARSALLNHSMTEWNTFNSHILNSERSVVDDAIIEITLSRFAIIPTNDIYVI